MEGTNMEPLGNIISRSVNQTDRVAPVRQMSLNPVADGDAVGARVEGSEAGTSPFSPEEISAEKIDRIARALENYVRSAQTDLSIKIHGATGDIMVQVISKSDGKVIREIPPKELLDLAAKIEEMVGVIFDKSA
jgi:uncharacterized FlaG/YvyC family protein